MRSNQSKSVDLSLRLGSGCRTGEQVLAGVLGLAQSTLDRVPLKLGLAPDRFAATGRIRGTGPGVSFGGVIAALEAHWPLTLEFPFEGAERVGGAAWIARDLIDPSDPRAAVKLHWRSGADDLPMHTHTGSSRFIVVTGGRGFFHVSGQEVGAFDGSEIQTIAARRNDVFLFTPGVVHTFSTADEPMSLLSCHFPYIPLDASEQYELPPVRWTAGEHLDHRDATITATGWAPLVAQ